MTVRATLRATVRVPLEGDGWLTVSVATPTEGGLRVERGGALAQLDVTPDDDRIVVGFRAACAAARRSAPEGLHVRAVAPVALEDGNGAGAAATLAGAAAASALLGLDLDHERLTALVAGLNAPSDALAAAVAGHSVVVRTECPS